MPKAIVLDPLAIAKLMMDPTFMYVAADHIAVVVRETGHIIVIPGNHTEKSEPEIQKVLQDAIADLS